MTRTAPGPDAEREPSPRAPGPHVIRRARWLPDPVTAIGPHGLEPTTVVYGPEGPPLDAEATVVSVPVAALLGSLGPADERDDDGDVEPDQPAPAPPAPVASEDGEAPPWRVSARAGERHFEAERQRRIVIGSAASCHWVLPDAGVRPVHGELIFDGGWWLCARAPIRYLGVEVQGWVQVASGDRVELGATELTLELALLDEPPAPEAVPEAVPEAAPRASELFRLPHVDEPSVVSVTEHTRRSPRPRLLALVALVVAGGAYLVTARAGAPPRRRPPPTAAAVPRPAPAPSPAPVAPVTAFSPAAAEALMRRGAEALLAHDHAAALVAYRRLAAEVPGNPMAITFVRAIESRLAEPCRRDGRPLTECVP